MVRGGRGGSARAAGSGLSRLGAVFLAPAHLTVLVLGQPASAQPPGDPAQGEMLAVELCSACHLVSERQTRPAIDSVPTFLGIAERLDDAEIEALLLAPDHPVMPEPPLSATDRRDVLAYIRSLAEN